MNVEIPQTILRSCPVRVTGSPDLNLTGTTRAAAGTAGTAIRVSIEDTDEPPPEVSTKPPREVEACIEFANVPIRKPTIFENNGAVTPMYPNDARLRNLTYAAPVYTDIIATFTMKTPNPDGEPIVTVARRTLPHVQIGRVPVMVGSNFCLLSDTPEKTPRELGECSEDIGGYFIIQGGERVCISQERMSENRPFVFRNNRNSTKELEVVEVKSIGPDNDQVPKSNSVRIMYHPKNSQIHLLRATIPRMKAPIPLFILFKALGIKTDKECIDLILGPGGDSTFDMILQESIAEASHVNTQEQAYEALASYIKVWASRGNRPQIAIQDILAEGIHVITTLNIQHLESLSEPVARITASSLSVDSRFVT